VFVEIDEVAVPLADWVAVLRGDVAAAKRIRGHLDGIVTYCHALSVGGECAIVTLRELDRYGCIGSVQLRKES
jgi:hypothetical protein